VYGKLLELFVAQPTIAEDETDLTPLGLYQVAIDCPGWGKSEGVRSRKSVTPEFLLDLVRCLGKQYALALVGCGGGSQAIVSSLAESPGLASFVVLRGPSLAIVDSCDILLHPTLITAEIDPAKPSREQKAMLKAATDMGRKLPHLTVKECTKQDAPNTLSELMIAHFKNNRWKGYMPGVGVSTKWPSITRVAGGVKAWSGEEAGQPLSSEQQYQQQVADALAAASAKAEPDRGAKAGVKATKTPAVSVPRPSSGLFNNGQAGALTERAASMYGAGKATTATPRAPLMSARS